MGVVCLVRGATGAVPVIKIPPGYEGGAPLPGASRRIKPPGVLTGKSRLADPRPGRQPGYFPSTW
ncbi:hypothetical protein MFU01_16980 [Myxococcus fulvus]|uniref:Uncharacterized protein n=1 Tax=Myxococcus fulvus TaxID=33 RepID=A0A511SXM7_MYXFU|nr:hypothetical protein MFU01_16980 [Myxococcus fulvus]